MYRIFKFHKPTAFEFLIAIQNFDQHGPGASDRTKIYAGDSLVTGFTAREEHLPDGTFSTRIDLHLE